MTRITPFQGYTRCLFVTQGRRASRLPLAIILRAVGALDSTVGALNYTVGALNYTVGALIRLFVQSTPGKYFANVSKQRLAKRKGSVRYVPAAFRHLEEFGLLTMLVSA